MFRHFNGFSFPCGFLRMANTFFPLAIVLWMSIIRTRLAKQKYANDNLEDQGFLKPLLYLVCYDCLEQNVIDLSVKVLFRQFLQENSLEV